MKKKFLLLFIFSFQNHFGQALSLEIISDYKAETILIDSIGYKRKHIDVKSIFTEVQKFSNQLLQTGYLENEVLDSKKINDTLYQFNVRLRIATKSLWLNVGKTTDYIEFETDTIILPMNNIESFLKLKLSELEMKGFSLATLRLIDFKKENNQLFATLKIDTNKKRFLDEIVINGYEKFPAGYKKNIQRLYRKQTFNKGNLKKIFNDFNNLRFISQSRYPEILFTEDSTKVFVYLEKAKSNRFDGFIGFANDEQNNLNLTGYLDVELINVLNAGEAFNLYWKSDDNEQVSFNVGIELPYIFKSPLAIKTNLNIFKQDSTFQNTKTAIDLGYYFTNNKKIFVGYQSTASSDIQNTNSTMISDFENRFYTATFDYKNFVTDVLFPEKTKILLKTGFGQRTSKLETNRQTFFEVNFSHNLFLNKKNIVNLRSQNFYLQSTNFITNELFRFGGIQSVRGFNENSLQANTFTSILTEYRYVLSPSLYVHSVLDYGFYEDRTTSTKNNLLGLGFGLGIRSKSGLLNLIYANGSTRNQVIKLTNSVVHVQFVTKF